MTAAGSSAFARLVADFADQVASLADVADGCDPAALLLPTPAAGWTVADSLAHLATFDENAAVAITEPDRFRADLADALRTGRDLITEGTRRGRAAGPEATRRWWHDAGDDLATAIAGLEPGERLPWYGPDMGAMSFVTARLMEHWAHGIDVRDALGFAPDATDRLRHIADLGVRTRGFSYVNRGLDAPSVPVRVDLVGPDGTRWTWGDAEASDLVSGSALGFCLVVTQRRNITDTDVVATGAAAREWLGIAQAFAGGPSDGRPPRSAAT